MAPVAVFCAESTNASVLLIIPLSSPLKVLSPFNGKLSNCPPKLAVAFKPLLTKSEKLLLIFNPPLTDVYKRQVVGLLVETFMLPVH